MPVSNDEIVEELYKPIGQVLANEGITIEYLAKKLKQELNATVVKTHYDPKRGEIVYSKKLPAWEIRQRARQDAHRLLNHYPANKHELTGANGQPITFVLNMGDDTDADTEEGREEE